MYETINDRAMAAAPKDALNPCPGSWEANRSCLAGCTSSGQNTRHPYRPRACGRGAGADGGGPGLTHLNRGEGHFFSARGPDRIGVGRCELSKQRSDQHPRRSPDGLKRQVHRPSWKAMTPRRNWRRGLLHSPLATGIPHLDEQRLQKGSALVHTTHPPD